MKLTITKTRGIQKTKIKNKLFHFYHNIYNQDIDYIGK